MPKVIPKISEINLSIKIEGLWRENNVFEWRLNPDVNILSGANGSGKSTILRILYAVLTDKNGILKSELFETADGEHFAEIKEFKKASLILNNHKEVIDGDFDMIGYRFSFIPEYSHYPIDFFASLDQKTVSREDIQAVANQNTNISSQLDFDLYHHQIRYTKYLLSIAKKAEKAYASGENIQDKLAEIYAQKNLFFEIIDNLFAETSKKIDRESDDFQFIKGEDTPLSVYQLSTGEKQIVLILLKALLQNNLHSIYLLDEPEISLHPDWQESLIDNIRQLNPNALLIIATHSPDLIVNGWSDKVVDMRDLLKPLAPAMSNGTQIN